MDLFKKSTIIFTLICVQHVGAALTKFEKQKAMILQGHLKRLAERSKRKPLPVSMHKGVDAALKSLEMLEKKDPELHSAVKNAATIVEAIQYVAPVQTELEQQERNQKVAEQERRDAKAQLRKRKNATLREFRQHLALLQDNPTWENKKPTDEWIKKVLVMLRNPELMNVTIESELNAPSTLLERLSNTYELYILEASRADKKDISEQFKQAKNNFLQTLTDQVLAGYFEQLSKAGNFWDERAVTINKVWLNELLQFLCYVMRLDPSDIKVQQLKKLLKNVVTKKFKQENAAEAESLAKVANEIDEFLNKCQQALRQKEQANKGPLQKIETQFITLMNIIGAAPRTEETEKTYENDALAIAKEWLNIVPVDQLNVVVEKIKGLYKDALKKQVTLTGFKKWIFSEKPTAALENSFNKALDDFVATKVEAVATQREPEQPVQQEEQRKLPGEEVVQPAKQPSVQVPPITTNPKVPVTTQTVPTTIVSQPPVVQQPSVGEKVVEGENKKEKEKEEVGVSKEVAGWINDLLTTSYLWNQDNNSIMPEAINSLIKIYREKPDSFNEVVLRTELQQKLQNIPADTLTKTLKQEQQNREVDRVINRVKEGLTKLATQIDKLSEADSWEFGYKKISTLWLNDLIKIYTEDTESFDENQLKTMLMKKLDNLPDGLFKNKLDNADRNRLSGEVIANVKTALGIQEQPSVKKEITIGDEIAAQIDKLGESGSWLFGQKKIYSSWKRKLVSIYKKDPKIFFDDQLRGQLRVKLDGLPRFQDWTDDDKNTFIEEIISYVKKELE